MAEDLIRGDRKSYVAYVSREGDKRVVFRYRDDSTRIVENGVASSGGASDTTTWWR